ncbi:COG4223 family protein, partial [Roseibium sp. RKSG952]|uniref:COG4223 family protein n=1 Tax=Roseibium sp. RKSG952 TaxID=2529384 RepID=UPI0018AD1156
EAEAEMAVEQTREEPIVQSQEKRGGFVPALIGGAVAAAIGFAAGSAGIFGSGQSDAITALESKINDQSSQIEALTKSVSDTTEMDTKIAALTDQISPITSELDAVKSGLDSLTSKVDPLTTRLNDLESGALTQSVSPEASAAFEAELKKLQDSLAAQRAEVEKMVSDAQALEAKAAADAKAATNTATLSRLQGQLDAGLRYDDLITELQAGGVTVPDALSGPADKGVATIAELNASFAPAARAALADARDADKSTGFVAFLQRQTGARSVTPQEGDDPDAILSRAQAALAAGDLSKALTELKSLPESAQSAMADWEQVAQTRLSAVDAANALASSVNSN